MQPFLTIESQLMHWRQALSDVESAVAGDPRFAQRLESFRQKLAGAENKALGLRQGGAVAERRQAIQDALRETDDAFQLLRKDLCRASLDQALPGPSALPPNPLRRIP